MDTLFDEIWNWQFALFCLAIGAILFVFRTIVEYLMTKYTSIGKETALWNKVILPILPIFMGALGARFISSYPYPITLVSNAGRVAWGLLGGFTSGAIVRLYFGLLSAKISSVISQIPATIVPASSTPTVVAVVAPITPEDPSIEAIRETIVK